VRLKVILEVIDTCKNLFMNLNKITLGVPMSAKLEKALAAKQVLIRKKTTGEVVVRFKNKDIKNVILSNRTVLDLLSKRGVTPEAVRQSNLKELIKRNHVEVK
jgi:hypothetical protein